METINSYIESLFDLITNLTIEEFYLSCLVLVLLIMVFKMNIIRPLRNHGVLMGLLAMIIGVVSAVLISGLVLYVVNLLAGGPGILAVTEIKYLLFFMLSYFIIYMILTTFE